MDRDNRLNSDWFIGVKNEDKEDFEKEIRNHQKDKVLRKVLMILERRLEIMETAENSVQLYNDGWQFKQAHYNGARASLKYMLDLLSFVDPRKGN